MISWHPSPFSILYFSFKQEQRYQNKLEINPIIENFIKEKIIAVIPNFLSSHFTLIDWTVGYQILQ
jgi:hypothetical protein